MIGRALAVATGVVALSLAFAAPAYAEDPITDAATKTEIVDSLSEATEVQGVCYGWQLQVEDYDTGQFAGDFDLSNAGIDTRPDPASCPKSVVLEAFITYTSAAGEAEDFAQWAVVSSGVTGPTSEDLERLGLKASALLKDSQSELTFTNAVLALPGLTSELGGVPPLILPTERATPPADARATDRPGSDRFRERGGMVAVLVLLILAALAWAAISFRPPSVRGPASLQRYPVGPYAPPRQQRPAHPRPPHPPEF